MRHVQFPHVMLVAEFHGLPEDFFQVRIVLHVPINLGLLHQHRYVPKENQQDMTLKKTKQISKLVTLLHIFYITYIIPVTWLAYMVWSFKLSVKWANMIFRVSEFCLHSGVGMGWRVIQSIFFSHLS